MVPRSPLREELMTITRAARLAAVVAAAALSGCGQGQPQQSAATPPAVTAANPVQRTVVDQDEYVGRFADGRFAVGNLITGGAGGATTLLAAIVSVDPIRFEFSFDEASYLRYVRFATSSQDVASLHGNVPVTLKLIDEKDFPHLGKIDFVDNVIDRSSGTIRGRAVFGNGDGIFTPGMFGRIRVPGSPPYA